MLAWDNASRLAQAVGLTLRGAARLRPEERVGDLLNRDTVLLLGWVDGEGWPKFAASFEAGDGLPDPLDRWSRRVISTLAGDLDATAIFPSDGPPYFPFQRWAQRAEPVFPSPLGVLVHPLHGLWHSYRGALALNSDIEASVCQADSPCDTCVGQPCLTTCPVRAFSDQGYDVAGCAAFLRTPEGADCMAEGCRARRACPVARVYSPEQAGFHMRAFLAGR